MYGGIMSSQYVTVSYSLRSDFLDWKCLMYWETCQTFKQQHIDNNSLQAVLVFLDAVCPQDSVLVDRIIALQTASFIGFDPYEAEVIYVNFNTKKRIMLNAA
jgi:hypothetical protein